MHMESKRTTIIIRADLLSAARAATGIPRKTDHGARLTTRDLSLRAAARRIGVPGK